MGMTICLAPRGGCGGDGFRSRLTRRVFGRSSIFASSPVVRRRMTKMSPVGYPAPQYLQSGRVRKKQLLTGAEGIFGSPARAASADAEARQAELFEQIGRLKMELEWLKKKLPSS